MERQNLNTRAHRAMSPTSAGRNQFQVPAEGARDRGLVLGWMLFDIVILEKGNAGGGVLRASE